MSEQPMSLSVVVPFYNEQGSVAPLIDEIHDTLSEYCALEIIAVDDGSTDETARELRDVRARLPAVRVLVHAGNAGQSAALVTGIRAASADVVATLDGDGQNPPAAIADLLAVYAEHAPEPVLVVGRRHKRNDSRRRRLSSRIANRVRRWALDDGCDDTGCGLKVFSRTLFLELPQFDHMHRFLPALAARARAPVVNVDVDHRERSRGVSKYGVGNRLWVGIIDLMGVFWLQRRTLVSKGEVHEYR